MLQVSLWMLYLDHDNHDDVDNNDDVDDDDEEEEVKKDAFLDPMKNMMMKKYDTVMLVMISMMMISMMISMIRAA